VTLSIITPAFNEAINLPLLYERLAAVMAGRHDDWEWVIVDDHSRDRTFAVVEELALRDARVRGLRLARNSGSHVAITCALHHVTGDAAALLAADLQDPPDLLAEMLERWRNGAQVVWAVRRQRPGEPHHQGFAAIYYWIMRRLVGLSEMPARGADFFLIDRAVIEAFCKSAERNVSVFALLTWLGFRQEYIEYDKQQRVHGQSGWTLAKKTKLVIDSVVAFSDFPIRWCGYLGVGLIGCALLVAVGALFLLPTLGAGLLLVTALVLGLTGVQLTALSIVGQYAWRALDEARGRPAYAIEAVAGRQQASRLA
jgi:glycosyltransferase involved in cell wall biosynthesis